MRKDEGQVVSEHDAARYISMSVHFLRKARYKAPTEERAPGPTYYKIGRSIRYNLEDLDAWLAEHRRCT